jgi:hypothetical protein
VADNTYGKDSPRKESMLRKLALLLLPLTIFAAACGGSDKNSRDASSATLTPGATATPTYGMSEPTTSAPATKGPTPIVIATPNLGGADSVLSAFNPLQLLDGIESGSVLQTVNPQLESSLLVASDLPSGFMSLGTFGFDIPSASGPMQMAANMFASGDPTSGDMGPMVMSAAVALPPDAAAQLRSLPSLSDADLDQLRATTSELGVQVSDLRVLGASGLGESGAGMHMVMDLSGLLDSFGAPADVGNPFQGGIAIDMYMFVQGDHMYMAMVMWPASGSSGVDARHLADLLDSRTGGNL